MPSSASVSLHFTASAEGAGVAGLGAVKNLIEQGFDVTAFEQTDHIGGLWTWDPSPTITTTLKSEAYWRYCGLLSLQLRSRMGQSNL